MMLWSAAADGAAACAEFTPFGQPGKAPELDVICHTGQLAGFNPERNVSDWVAYRLRRSDLLNQVVPRKDQFREDPEAPEGHRVDKDDYVGTGYDRGHLAPAGAMRWSAAAMSDSFYMTNMAPQVGAGFNRGIWRSLERRMRQWACERGTLYIVTGPLYERPRIERMESDTDGDGEDDNGILVDVPTHFYKAALDPATMDVIAFVLENRKLAAKDLRKYMTSVLDIEARSRIDFFSDLWDGVEYVIESHVQPKLWEQPTDERCRRLQ